jgi:putative ATP-dependent endonuclease of the OLD family
MQIVSVRIRDFRAIEDLTVNLDAYTALVGANGSGKSAVLHALNWFFNGTKVDEFDYRVRDDGTVATFFSVDVAISGLDPATSPWSKYIRGDQLALRRTSTNGGTDQLSGGALQGPGFADIRGAADVATRRTLFAQARALHSDIAAATSKADIENALDDWEMDAAHSSLLVEVANADLTHAFGFNGKNLLAETIQFVLVPASARLEDNVDPAGKGGAIDQLLGAAVKQAADAEVATWTIANSAKIDSLGASISGAVESASRSHMDNTNKFLGEIIAGAKIELAATTQRPKIQPQVDVSATLVFEGPSLPISRQGHGVQRSVMVSTLQAAASTVSHGGQLVVLAIEEPELYQHPARSLALSRALIKLADGGHWQSIVATHSPHFLGNRAAASLRRFYRQGGVIGVIEGSLSGYAAKSGKPEHAISRHLETLLPSEFSEAFFVDRVALVEGITDKIVLGHVAQQVGIDVDGTNQAIVDCQGKGNIHIASSILASLDIEVCVLFDGDLLPAGDEQRHRKSTSELVKDLKFSGILASSEEFTFGEPSVIFSKVAILQDKLETELEAWPSYSNALHSLCGSTRSKNPYIVREALALSSITDCPSLLIGAARLLKV